LALLALLALLAGGHPAPLVRDDRLFASFSLLRLLIGKLPGKEYDEFSHLQA